MQAQNTRPRGITPPQAKLLATLQQRLGEPYAGDGMTMDEANLAIRDRMRKLGIQAAPREKVRDARESTRLGVLRLLCSSGPMKARLVGEALGVSEGRAGSALGVLKRRGLVERVEGGWVPTAAGREAVRDA